MRLRINLEDSLAWDNNIYVCILSVVARFVTANNWDSSFIKELLYSIHLTLATI